MGKNTDVIGMAMILWALELIIVILASRNWSIRMNNQVAAPCCGSCEHCKGSAIGLRCYERTPYEVTGLRNSCMEGRNYSPCNPIFIIDIPGVKELVEGVYKEGFKVGYETGDHDKAYPESANAYRTIKFYKYMKALEDKDD